MNILSLFDGISCARVALEKANIKVDKYYASEIDKYAMQISHANYPDTIRLGDITTIDWNLAKSINSDFNSINLLIGGSPCQGLSMASQYKKGLEDNRSGLFFEYVKALKTIKPKYFILENVNYMSKENKNKITDIIGVEPIMIDAALVSAQKRKRLFWTNISNITQPEDRKIYLKDIIQDGFTEHDKSYTVIGSVARTTLREYNRQHGELIFNKPIITHLINKGRQGERIYNIDGKSVTITNHGGGIGANTGLYKINEDYRRLTPLECERLQCLPDGYTDKGVSNTQRYKCLGNAFNVDVIAHILSFIRG